MTKTILLTGATGFLASHLVRQSLAEGHAVTATVRKPDDAASQAHLLTLPGAAERLTLTGFDLADPAGLATPVDADCIMHLAWPERPTGKAATRAYMALTGQSTLAVLKAAAQSPRVSRVILTSALDTMAHEPGDSMITEERWNIASSIHRNVFAHAKTEAERAAWAFMKSEKPHFRLITINPAPIIGPVHDKRLTDGNAVFAEILQGRYGAILPVTWPLVDVRDVAAAHLAAMATADADGRYLCVGAAIRMADLVEMIARNGYKDANLPRKGFSGILRRSLASPANLFRTTRPDISWHNVPDRGHAFSNAKLRGDLGIWFRHQEDMIADALADLAGHGHIPEPGPKEPPKSFSWDKELLGQ